MDASDEERQKAKAIGELCGKKLRAIMELQADLDALMRGEGSSPLGPEKWKNGRLEELQRLVLMVAIQFVCWEPEDWVPGNKEVNAKGIELMGLISAQLTWLAKNTPQRG